MAQFIVKRTKNKRIERKSEIYMTPEDLCYKWGEYYHDPDNFNIIHCWTTRVKVKQSFIDRMARDGKKLAPYASFVRLYRDNDGTILLTWHRQSKECYLYGDALREYDECERYIDITPFQLKDFIEEYVNDIQYEISYPEYQPATLANTLQHESWGIWILCIIVMIASLIFKDFWILWIIELIFFNTWRNDEVNKRR